MTQTLDRPRAAAAPVAGPVLTWLLALVLLAVAVATLEAALSATLERSDRKPIVTRTTPVVDRGWALGMVPHHR